MVFRVEEAVAAVAAPDADAAPGGSDLRVCAAAFEGARYFLYASDTLVVVLVENQDAAATMTMTTSAPQNARSDAKRTSLFDLWQIWNADDAVKCIRFNNATRKTARGAVAVCIEEGRGVLLMPCAAGVGNGIGAAASISTAVPSTKSDDGYGGMARNYVLSRYPSEVSSDYAKVHLNLQRPTWRESVRWKSDDRLLDRVEWVESGEDLFLIGAGEKITVWKIIDDAVQVYLQRSFALGCNADTGVSHFDATLNGRFIATAGVHDRILKVWNLNELAHDGKPICLFLAHQRALQTVKWVKEMHTYKMHSAHASTTIPTCEILISLDKAGNISIWRELIAAPVRSFTLWKIFSCQDYLFQPDADRFFVDAERDANTKLRTFGLVNNHWARPLLPNAGSSIADAMLEEANVLAALSMFHYGHSSLDDARRSELYTQRMDGFAKMNSKLLGDRSGAIADTHAGETFICGNATLNKTFSVYLLYGIHDNGDLCLFRTEFIAFSGVAPRVSVLLLYSGLRTHLVDANVFSISSSDYKDRENGSSTFVIEILIQSRSGGTHLKMARLKLHAESAYSGRGNRGSVSYSVQSCEVGDMCNCMFGARQERGEAMSLAISKARASNGLPHANAGGMPLKVAVSNIDRRLDIFHMSASLRSLRAVCRPHATAAMGSMTHSVCYEEQCVLYFFADASFRGSFTSTTEETTNLAVCFVDAVDEDENALELEGLIVVRVPESLKMDWGTPSTSIFGKVLQQKPSSKDFCVVLGLNKTGTEVVVWVFAFETVVVSALQEDGEGKDESFMAPGSSTLKMTLFRKTRVGVPHKTLVSVSSVPSLQSFEIVFGSMDSQGSLNLWTFADLDDLLELKSIQTTNAAELVKSSVEKPKDVMNFNVVEDSFKFKQFAFSACGRVAVLFEKEERGGDQQQASSSSTSSTTQPSNDDAHICVLPAFETCCEGIVTISQKKLGVLVSLEWTPPVTPERDCELLFLSTTTIGMLKRDASAPSNKWYIAWSSSRFTVRPQKISSLTSYPHALLALGTSIASINLHDLSGATSTGAYSGLPFRISSSISPPLPLPSSSSGSSQNAFPVHHPVTLMFLLLRGSFQSLEKVLEHVKASILEHEKACYLRMMDGAPLQDVPLLSLAKFIGNATGSPTENEEEEEERSAVYLNGKQKPSTGSRYSYNSSYSSTAAPARASDLFSMDYGASRNVDRAELLFAPRGSSMSAPTSLSLSEQATETSSSALESNVFPLFFSKHKNSMSFLAPQECEVFMAVINGMKKTILWERDASRKKDEAALRFQASLLWPLQQEIDDNPTSTPNQGGNADSSSPGEPVDEDEDAVRGEQRSVGICSEQVVWGAITDYQDELLQECFPTSMMTWKEMKQLRLPFWVKSVAKLQQFMEKAAQTEYAATRDPFHVALFYVLLGKTKLLASLFKVNNETRIYELLSNNFAEPRWKNAAIKNAYVLKAKRRYELSTAFFLLGGKVQEAMSVAEHADRSLVLSFLIARLSEKWDLGGQSDAYNSGSSGLNQFSFTGLSTNSLGSFANGAGDGDDACKDLCLEFLKTTVWSKARACGDIYMCFLVKYFSGETNSAIQSLLTVPSIEMRCMFGTCGPAYAYPYTLYWRAFGQSMLGACEIIRFLQSTITPLKAGIKTQIVELQTLALGRLLGMGLQVAALLQQRDFAKIFHRFCRDKPANAEVAAFLACRHHILITALGSQVDCLYATFLERIQQSMDAKAAAANGTFELEDRINEEVQCIVARAGDFTMEGKLETEQQYIEGILRSSIVQSLVHSGRLAGLDFLFAGWNRRLSEAHDPADGQMLPQFTSPLPHFIEIITEGITLVGLGDLMASSTDQLHTKRVDQTCSQLLSAASRLLLWLHYYYAKPSAQRSFMTSGEYVRVATAAIYSVICICCRYSRSPCCVYRSLGMIFPHKDALPKKALDELKEIALADVCVHCAASRNAAKAANAGPVPASSLVQDIPVLYQVIEMLQDDLNTFVADVKTNRLQLSSASSSPYFTYCQYWTLVLMMSASGMPAHISKIAVDGTIPASNSTIAAKKLVQVWTTYNAKLSKYATKRLLCDLAESYFRPFDAVAASSLLEEMKQQKAILALPPRGPRRLQRKMLGIHDGCSRMFTEKDELLLRINAQMECCSEKIKDEIRWGHLPELPSKKAALTRSQKILLSSAVGKAASGTPRAADLVDLFEKRMQTQAAPAVQLNSSCIYRSEVSIKSMCFNHATADTAEMILCSSKGICRTACVDYSGGSKFQFKGMYANPQASFFSDSNPLPPPARRRTAADNSGSSELNSVVGPPLSIGNRMLSGSPSSSSASLLSGTSSSLSDAKAPSFKPTAVESHPFLPLFVSGNQKGKVHLWSYDSLSAVCSFQMEEVFTPYPSSPSLSSRRDIKKIKFDNLGQQCHDKGAKALTFINSSSFLATVGSSSEKKSVCIWDLLLPNSKALVAAPVCHPAGAASVAFSSTHQLLISGGEGGSISVFDVRQRRVLHTVTNAHETAITTLELHPSGHCVLSGSASGDIKIWSLPLFREVTSLSKVHAKPSFLGDAASNILGDAASNMAINVTSSSWGVTDAVATDDYFFTSGTDGSVQRLKVPSLSKLF
uniref:RAVE complex protein Rav1 C-terminal domain-containing protein n=1 Tax=Globisporangium ultimum (strain ATCC 200006 / CBS 805.95 / DAOM BR144) TaxID=431595 RepID=K3X8Q7_GLOUD